MTSVQIRKQANTHARERDRKTQRQRQRQQASRNGMEREAKLNPEVCYTRVGGKKSFHHKFFTSATKHFTAPSSQMALVKAFNK